jgi:N-methylhydantoinase A
MEPIAKSLHLSVEATAAGIVTLIENAMAKVLRIVTVERGFDPRDFTLVAFGGGGPLHACALSDELHLKRILVPANPGLFSAQGLLQAQLHVTSVHSILRAADAIDAQNVEAVFLADEDAAQASLLAQGADPQTIRFRREYDARYRGQSFELTIAYDPSFGVVERRFHEAHRGRYGYDAPGDVVEVVNARLTATAEVQSGTCQPDSLDVVRNKVRRRPERTKRHVWLDGAFVSAPVFARSNLADGDRIEGPAIVEAYDSTTYVAPRWRLVAQDDLLVLERTAL